MLITHKSANEKNKQVQIPTQSAHSTTAMLHNAFKTDLLPLLAVIVASWLAYPFALPVGKSHCAMTYMYPSYIDVSNVAGTHPNYNLYLYREGRPFYHDARKGQGTALLLVCCSTKPNLHYGHRRCCAACNRSPHSVSARKWWQLQTGEKM